MNSDWIHKAGGKIICELTNGEIAYTIPWAFIEYPQGNYNIFQDTPCMPIKFGTCEVMIQRFNDTILIKDGAPYEGWSELWRKDALADGKPFFIIRFEPLSITEKVGILWDKWS